STFWTNGKSVGWMNKNQIEINIEFSSKKHISQLSLNTANGEKSGVYYANNIYVFSTSDKKTYKYLGDLMNENSLKSTHNKSVVNLVLKNVNLSDKYFKFIIIPKGNYFFTDEIQFFETSFSKEREYPEVKEEGLKLFIDDLVHKDKVTNESYTLDRTSSYLKQQVKQGVLVEDVDIVSQLKSSEIGSLFGSILEIHRGGFIEKPILNVFRVI